MLTVKSKAPPESVDAFHFFFFISLYGEKAIFRHHSQAVRQRSAKPLFPSSILGGASKTKSTSKEVLFCFGTMCSAPAERDVHFVRDVAFGSDVHFVREDAEHITSLCDEGAIHHYGEAITSLRRSRYITLYKRSKCAIINSERRCCDGKMV